MQKKLDTNVKKIEHAGQCLFFFPKNVDVLIQG